MPQGDPGPEVDALERILHLRKDSRILDVGCGAGRHAIELAKRGYRVTGIDLSSALLAEARKSARREAVRVTFAREDMRRLAAARKFDAVISMFTSFGFFDRAEEDRAVVAGYARVLKPRGRLVMELLNRENLAPGLPRQGWSVREDGSVILVEDDFDLLRGRFETRQTVIDREGTRSYVASVRAYTLAEIKALLESENLFVHRVLGGLDLSAYTARSPRMVLCAAKGIEPETIRTMW